ncbi:ER membrane complex subunit 3 [Gaertneriomyces sp. JEL0708]|nr:ER membrane complex subunit 3 [Gaertneriomyces sp. JEL0708]
MAHDTQQIFLDPAIRDWVLIPIMLVMVLVGVLRHHATQLLTSTPKGNFKAVRESAALLRARTLRSPVGFLIPYQSFVARRTFLASAFEKGAYLKNPQAANQGAANPMGDPAAMEGMMDMLKKNVAMIIPQTLIMSWITFFFSGFVLIKLPFPLTVRFKAMLQRGIETSDMDVTWVSSLSWYFLNLFGLRSIYNLILGEDNAAGGLQDMNQMQMMPGAGAAQPMQQPQEVMNMFKSEKEFLELAQHEWVLKDVELRVLKMYGIDLQGGQKKQKDV